jgi:hypothetical protein
MSNDQPCINPIESQREEALRHYRELADKCHHWSSFVEHAIKAYNPNAGIESNLLATPLRVEQEALKVLEILDGAITYVETELNSNYVITDQDKGLIKSILNQKEDNTVTSNQQVDMSAKEMLEGLFNLDFLSDEEKETIYKATELYAEAKVRNYVASLGNSDNTSVVSHPCTSSNSIQQIEAEMKEASDAQDEHEDGTQENTYYLGKWNGLNIALGIINQGKNLEPSVKGECQCFFPTFYKDDNGDRICPKCGKVVSEEKIKAHSKK